MKKVKKLLALLSAVLCMLTAAGCAFGNQESRPEQSSETTESAAETTVPVPAQTTAPEAEASAADDTAPFGRYTGTELSKADLNTEWGSDAAEIRFGDGKIECTADGVTVTDTAVRITKGGDYVLSGSRDHTAVIVDLADEQEKVHLVLNGLALKTTESAPVTVIRADKTVITLADGTFNSLCDARNAASDESVPFACIASNEDLTINGSGTLTVESSAGTGIQSSDDLKLVSGNVTVSAGKHGLRGNDSVLLCDGTLDIIADGDGIKSTTADKEGKGWILAQGGTVTVTAQQDGIEAASSLSITGGTISITAGGGAPETVSGDDMPFGGGFRPFGRYSDDPEPFPSQEPAKAESSTGSSKGIKAETAIAVSGGTVTVDASDDAVHTNGDAAIFGEAVLTVSSGDDGLHADASLTIGGGDIRIAKSAEGIEAETITMDGGNVHVTSSDDGVNASDGSGGGMGFNRNGTGSLTINGGYLYVNSGGDGLDSNGDILMTGGTAVVCGPTNDGNGPLDSGDNNNTITVTGGTLIAVGSTGMMETPAENYLASASLQAAAGTLIVVTDDSGKVLAALKTPKQAQGIVVSANGMQDGYHIYTGGDYQGELNEDGFGTGGSYSGGKEIASGSGGGRFGSGGFGHGRPGDMPVPDGFAPPGGYPPPEGKQPPGGMPAPDAFAGRGLRGDGRKQGDAAQ